MDSWFFLSLPRYVDVCVLRGPEEAKNPAGKILRPIQIRLARRSLAKISAACQIKSKTFEPMNDATISVPTRSERVIC
jgi:hypothetical protein